MAINAPIPAPQPPPGGPSDWRSTVRGNSFSNVQRLALWIGGTTPINSGVDPSKYFLELGEAAVGAAVEGVLPTIYVVVHGWAPLYRPVVDAQRGNLLWWGSKASLSGRWASDWAWAPVGPLTSKPTFTVNPTGMLQQIAKHDSSADILAYSWIDDSATSDSSTSVYRSEAYTHINGLRLADALQKVIAPEFFQKGGLLKFIGHSHGSKVCTVAALALQQRNIRVAQLTIMDSPESNFPLTGNGANLLGFYLDQMDIRKPSDDGAAGALVDNYASYFGVGYTSANGSSPMDNIVEVALNPAKIYWTTINMGDAHTYAAGWYGGAAAGAARFGQPPVGLAWPPVQKPFEPALNQTWPGGTAKQDNQWLLAAGQSIIGTYSYAARSLSVTKGSTSGKVTGDPSTGLVFSPASSGWKDYSSFVGTFNVADDQYGLAFDIEWQSPQAGDYLVVTAGGNFLTIYTLLVIDGVSAPIGKTSVAISSDIWGSSGTLSIYFLGSSQFARDQVKVSNFRWVYVGTANGPAVVQAAAEKGPMQEEVGEPLPQG